MEYFPDIRCQRFGKFVKNKQRPIIVKFNRYNDKQLIYKQRLNGSTYFVLTNFSGTVKRNRKQLFSINKKAKKWV